MLPKMKLIMNGGGGGRFHGVGLKYDPNQPRDADGKWGDGGGGQRLSKASWVASFSEEDWRVAGLWSGSMYYQMKTSLRNPNSPNSRYLKEGRRWNSLLNSCEPNPGTYHRGASLSDEDLERFKPGNEVEFGAPMSMTSKASIAEKFSKYGVGTDEINNQVRFVIKSKRAVDMQPLYEFPGRSIMMHTDEAEFVEPMGSKFKVKKIEKLKEKPPEQFFKKPQKKWRIHLEAI
jgi:hypothetical protein